MHECFLCDVAFPLRIVILERLTDRKKSARFYFVSQKHFKLRTANVKCYDGPGFEPLLPGRSRSASEFLDARAWRSDLRCFHVTLLGS